MTSTPDQTTADRMPGKTPQGSHHWVITLELPGRVSVTATNTFTPLPGWTRHDVFQAIKHEVAKDYPALADGSVVFFSLEPNRL